MKIAVLLFNLGGPDSPAAVQPFLFNLFNDPAIIRLPGWLRFLVAKLISTRRAPVAAEIYAKMGGRSPILPNTEAQAAALEAKLQDVAEVKCFIAMRYWHPFMAETMAEIKAFAPQQVVMLPLYPQFSTTTTASSLKQAREIFRQADPHIKLKTICCYPTETGFITAMNDAISKAYQAMLPKGKPRILFSAHGLPEKIVKAGDPYQWQCEQTTAALVQSLNIPDLDWQLCFQSRVGPLKWIGPATDDEIKRAGTDKVPLIVVPIAFVSEHSETLVEIDQEYRHLAAEHGVPHFAYVPTVGTAPDFIGGLEKLVRAALADRRPCISQQGERICPNSMSGCGYRD